MLAVAPDSWTLQHLHVPHVNKQEITHVTNPQVRTQWHRARNR